MGLTKDQQEILLKLARNTIGTELGLESKSFSKNSFSDEEFDEIRGVFVTLEINGHLRGCIGNIEPTYSLYEAVEHNAFEAAFRDSRFHALQRDEFPILHIEVSVLTLPKKLEYDGPEDLLEKLEAGKHGVVLQQDFRKATYLPQVWEELPEKEEFLPSLCAKAGLNKDAWKDSKTEIFVYEVEKFEEE